MEQITIPALLKIISSRYFLIWWLNVCDDVFFNIWYIRPPFHILSCFYWRNVKHGRVSTKSLHQNEVYKKVRFIYSVRHQGYKPQYQCYLCHIKWRSKGMRYKEVRYNPTAQWRLQSRDDHGSKVHTVMIILLHSVI
jgi:hypothetical protein